MKKQSFKKLNKIFKMGKKIVLIVLFILPLVVYMFFATGVNKFVNLPIPVSYTRLDVYKRQLITELRFIFIILGKILMLLQKHLLNI